jgi:hypothetical protein
MTLPHVRLDDRNWNELVAQARALIPSSAPGWTDHNAHDPGITLAELFAWLSEMLVYQLDRVSPALMRSFLRAMGSGPTPATVASTQIAVDRRLAATTLLPAGTEVTDSGSTIAFETAHALTLSPAWLEGGPDEQTDRGWLVSEVGGIRQRLANGMPGQSFWALGSAPRPGDALELGFDVLPAAPASELSLYVWTDSWESDGDERRRLVAEWSHSWRRHPSARTVWEFWDGAAWQSLEVRADETRALTLSGGVKLVGSNRHVAGPDDSRFWIRCRLDAGEYSCPPRLLAVAINAVGVRHSRAIPGPRPFVTSRGDPNLAMELGDAPIIPGSTKLRVTAADGTTDDGWIEVSEWDLTGPDDAHYRLDELRGTIAFGDGRVGRVPAAGSRISLLNGNTGGGPDGNVKAGILSKFVDATIACGIVQPFPARGGALRETVDQAHGRTLAMLDEAARAITTSDIERLVSRVPGAPVARAQTLPNYHPRFPCIPAPGALTVLVVPPCGRPPAPPQGLLLAVHRYLERRRPLTLELFVIGPVYVPVTVSARLHVAAGTNAAALPRLAQRLLDDFFDPLVGGPDGTGWPFGRPVLATELLALLGGVPGVLFVDELRLARQNGDPASCSTVSLCPTELVASQQHAITIVAEAAA